MFTEELNGENAMPALSTDKAIERLKRKIENEFAMKLAMLHFKSPSS